MANDFSFSLIFYIVFLLKKRKRNNNLEYLLSDDCDKVLGFFCVDKKKTFLNSETLEKKMSDHKGKGKAILNPKEDSLAALLALAEEDESDDEFDPNLVQDDDESEEESEDIEESDEESEESEESEEESPLDDEVAGLFEEAEENGAYESLGGLRSGHIVAKRPLPVDDTETRDAGASSSSSKQTVKAPSSPTTKKPKV